MNIKTVKKRINPNFDFDLKLKTKKNFSLSLSCNLSEKTQHDLSSTELSHFIKISKKIFTNNEKR